MNKRIIGPSIMATCMALAACSGNKTQQAADTPDYVTVRDGEFYIGDSVYRYVGTNFWYGAILASEGRGGDRERLAKELDTLQSIGINNLRILVGGDGEEGLASHISPTLQKTPGVYNDTLLAGLDYLLDNLEKRGMKAVLYLNNAWEWSGGFSTYLEWAGSGKAVNPATDWYPAYMEYASKFVLNDSAKNMAANNVKNIVSRVNSVTGKPYSESPAIMAWPVCRMDWRNSQVDKIHRQQPSRVHRKRGKMGMRRRYVIMDKNTFLSGSGLCHNPYLAIQLELGVGHHYC